MKNIIAIDTANNYCSIGLYTSKIILSDISNNQENMQSFSLIPMLEDILSKNNLTLKEIDKIIVTNGPASFTGIRVGLAFVTGLQITTNINMLTINSLAAYYIASLSDIDKKKKTLVINKATKDYLYCQYFENMNKVTDPILLSQEELAKIDHRNFNILGNNSLLQDKYNNYIYRDKINMSEIARLAALEESFNMDDFISKDIQPIYLRHPVS